MDLSKLRAGRGCPTVSVALPLAEPPMAPRRPAPRLCQSCKELSGQRPHPQRSLSPRLTSLAPSQTMTEKPVMLRVLSAPGSQEG